MKSLIILLVISCSGIALIAQDTIVKVNGIEIPCLVKEITPVAVKYKRLLNPDGPIYSMNLTEIKMIRYPNGVRDEFNNEPEIILIT
jgi:hypothetical protein